MGLVFIGGVFLWGWLEVSAFIFVSSQIGGLLTLLGVFLTAIIGIVFVKNQGLSVLNRVRSDLVTGQPPIASIADSVSLIVGGGLLLIPGYITDAIGLFLFIPPFRTMAGMYLIQSVAKSRNFNSFVSFGSGTFTQENSKRNPFGFNAQTRNRHDFDDVIEGEFEEQPAPKSSINQKKIDHQND